MVARIDAFAALTSYRPTVAAKVAPAVAQAAQACGQAPAARADRVEARPVIAPASMAALIHVQEHFAETSKAADKVSEVLVALIERFGHRKPEPPVTPPVITPAPVPTPVPVPVVVDSPAPARMLQMVREQLHARPASRIPDLPFSRREAAGAAYRSPRATGAPMAMIRAVAQGQAALMLIQAGQMNLYQRNAQPFSGAGGFSLFRNI
ncbi:hypothetical protein [Phenylobacterium sp.]|uniref:hypothetical protein n=1 Tax=Phenylobacterium sp. TaxID=1871053 RepID=UPI003983A77B